MYAKCETRSNLTEYRSMMISLDCFLRVHSMLNNFIEFLESRGFNLVHYKKIPFQGALEIANKILTPDVYENLCKCLNEPSDLFANYFRNTQCSKSVDTQKDTIETMIKYLTGSVTAENFSTSQVESVLFTLTRLPCAFASKKLQVLSVLLKEAAENMICCNETAKELSVHIQTQTLLDFISNFIREWGKKREKRSRAKICKLCGSITNDEARRYMEKSCCGEAEHLDQLLTEWISLHVSENASKFQFETAIDINILQDKFKKVQLDKLKSIYTDKSDKDVSSQVESLKSLTETQKHRRDILMKMDIDGIATEDLSKRKDSHIFREKVKVPADGIRSAKDNEVVAKEIRAKRDDNLYRSKLSRVIDKGQPDHRSVQRDMEKETDRSQVTKRRKEKDTEDMVLEEKDGKQVRVGSPYQHLRKEERETRLPDKSVKKIGRLDQVEEKSTAEITKSSARKLEIELNENGQRDRENEEKAVSHPDTKKIRRDKDQEEETSPLNKSKETRVGNKKTMDLLDGTKKEHYYVNEVGKLAIYDGKSKEISKLIEYQLSNIHFVNLGWTILPGVKVMRKIIQYETRPAKSYLDWFKKHRHKGTEYYDDRLTPFLKFHSDGSGELFYPNGILAIKAHRPKKRKYDMYTVFTPGGKDALGIERKSQILAIFDSMGNGVVFDEDGTARLSYNQIGGIFTDNPVGLPLVWTWNANPKKPILESVYTEKLTDHLEMEFFPVATKWMMSSGNVKTPISPSSLSNKEKKVEVQKPVVEQRQEEVGSKFKSNINKNILREDLFPIKIICMKLNEFLGLRIIDRRNIVLRFFAKNKSIRLELGTVLNFKKKLITYMVESDDWKNDMRRCRFQEKLSTKLESDSSLYDLAKEYRKVKRLAKQRKAIITKYRTFSKIGHRNILK